MRTEDMKWIREPAVYTAAPDRIEITTMPHTDLWQRTYYHFRNDNAPLLLTETEKKYFSLAVYQHIVDIYKSPMSFKLKGPLLAPA